MCKMMAPPDPLANMTGTAGVMGKVDTKMKCTEFLATEWLWPNLVAQ